MVPRQEWHEWWENLSEKSTALSENLKQKEHQDFQSQVKKIFKCTKRKIHGFVVLLWCCWFSFYYYKGMELEPRKRIRMILRQCQITQGFSDFRKRFPFHCK